MSIKSSKAVGIFSFHFKNRNRIVEAHFVMSKKHPSGPRDIQYFIKVGDLETVKKWLSKHVSKDIINSPVDCCQNRLLHIAAGFGKSEVAKLLIEKWSQY